MPRRKTGQGLIPCAVVIALIAAVLVANPPDTAAHATDEAVRGYRSGDAYDDGKIRGTIAITTDWYTDVTGRIRARKVYVKTNDGKRILVGQYEV